MKIEYLRDALYIMPETELEKIHMTHNVIGLHQDLCNISAEGNIIIKFKMLEDKFLEV